VPAGSVINSVTVGVRGKKTNTGDSASACVVVVNSIYFISLPLTTSTGDYDSTWTTNPTTGMAWNNSDLATLGAGVSAGKNIVGTVTVYEILYVKVDYTPSGTDAPFRACTSNYVPGAATSITLNKPTGTVDRDFMVMCIATSSVVSNFVAPDGWQHAQYYDSVTPNVCMQILWKRASGEGSSYNVSWTTGAHGVGILLTYKGTSPYTADDRQRNETTTGSSVTPAETATKPKDLVVCFYHVLTTDMIGDQGSAWVGPSGMTVRCTEDILQGAYQYFVGSLMACDWVQLASGAISAKTAKEFNNNTGNGQQIMVSFKGIVKDPVGAGVVPYNR